MKASESPVYWHIFTQLAAGLATRTADLSDADRARILDEVRAASEAFLDGGRLRLPVTALCALGLAA